MENSIPTNVSVAMPRNRMRIMVYIIIAVIVALTVATGFLMYERINDKINSKAVFDAPVAGGWTSWGSWADCTQSRFRSCSNPASRNGGAECFGDIIETKDCSLTGCPDVPINGGWAAWGKWTHCSENICGSGTHSRSRSCSSPKPSNGGIECIGNGTETEDCTTADCPAISIGCKDILQNGLGSNDGVYYINVSETGQRFQVYCDMTTDGGGWTVLQKRSNGSVDFYNNFHDYEHGFGSAYGEYWLGLKYIYQMTKGVTNELRLDLEKSTGEKGYAVYQSFSISGPSYYTLHIGDYNGTAGDGGYGLSYSNGIPFSTYDRDRDTAFENCAVTRHGGGWYKWCAYANLNGEYTTPGTRSSYANGAGGVQYFAFDGRLSLKSTEMKFRRKY